MFQHDTATLSIFVFSILYFVFSTYDETNQNTSEIKCTTYTQHTSLGYGKCTQLKET